jgi:23S rRNA pseudouridine2457 synthase
MRFSYLLFWKPYGVLTQFTDQEGRSTLKDYIDQLGVYPVGRLDQDSEGLLLLTDDGPLAHRLTDPRFDHPKTYWAQVEGIPDQPSVQALTSGVPIQNYRTRPARVRVLDQEPNLPPRPVPIRFRKAIPTTWIELILTEGKNRQVRRMTAAVGFPTLRLVRVAIGTLTLEGLEPGAWRQLTNLEVQMLKKQPY